MGLGYHGYRRIAEGLGFKVGGIQNFYCDFTPVYGFRVQGLGFRVSVQQRYLARMVASDNWGSQSRPQNSLMFIIGSRSKGSPHQLM